MMPRLFRRGYSCQQVMVVLQAYLDGEVDASVARKVAGHLNDCPPCDRESDVYRRLKVTLNRRRIDLDPAVAEALTDYVSRLKSNDVT